MIRVDERPSTVTYVHVNEWSDTTEGPVMMRFWKNVCFGEDRNKDDVTPNGKYFIMLEEDKIH